jgi:hypothetical protein
MTLDFDLSDLQTVEFGVCRDMNAERAFHCIPVDTSVQNALREMAEITWQELSKMEPAHYAPGEKYASQGYLFLPLTDNLAASMRELHEANNLPLDTNALSDPSLIYCYFARFTDTQGRRLTALRRAAHFKGVLRKRLIRLVTDSLKIIEDRVFKLDEDFDLLIDRKHIHILRPAAFEFTAQLQQEVLKAVPRNIALLQKSLSFIDFSNIETYAANHVRAARYLASILATQETQNISLENLKEVCLRTRVQVSDEGGKLRVDERHIIGFLEVLDRRRYELELIDGQPERFRAKSRERIQKGNGGQV